MGLLPAPPGMAPGDLAQAAADLVLLGRTSPSGEALGGAVLAGDPTGPALGDPQALDEHHHCSPSALRGQKFPVTRWRR